MKILTKIICILVFTSYLYACGGGGSSSSSGSNSSNESNNISGRVWFGSMSGHPGYACSGSFTIRFRPGQSVNGPDIIGTLYPRSTGGCPLSDHSYILSGNVSGKDIRLNDSHRNRWVLSRSSSNRIDGKIISSNVGWGEFKVSLKR